MLRRAAISLALCLTMLLASATGLNRCMVVSYDDVGHAVLTSAHGPIGHEHERGADHDPHDLPAGDGHAGDCTDGKLVKAEVRTASAEIPSPLDRGSAQQPLTISIIDAPDSHASAGLIEGHFWGSSARVDLACIRATILVI